MKQMERLESKEEAQGILIWNSKGLRCQQEESV